MNSYTNKSIAYQLGLWRKIGHIKGSCYFRQGVRRSPFLRRRHLNRDLREWVEKGGRRNSKCESPTVKLCLSWSRNYRGLCSWGVVNGERAEWWEVSWEWWSEAVLCGVLFGFRSKRNRKPLEGCELRMARCDLHWFEFLQLKVAHCTLSWRGREQLKNKQKKKRMPLWNLNIYSEILTEDLLIEHLSHTRCEVFYM